MKILFFILVLCVSGIAVAIEEFQCKFYKVPMKFRCDGVVNCVPDKTDEENCPGSKIFKILLNKFEDI